MAQALPLIGAAVGAFGAIKSAESQKEAAETIAGQGVSIPGDIRGLRDILQGTLSKQIRDPDFLSQDPNLDDLRNNILYFSSPEFFRQQSSLFDPQSIIDQQIQASLPAFRSDLNDILGGVRSQFSAQGGRFSSDLNRQQSQVGGDALQEFRSGFQNQLPDLLRTQIFGQSIIPSLIGGQTNAFNTLSAADPNQLAALSAALGLGTAGVGAGQIPASLAPFLGASGQGAGLQSAGNALPILGALLQNPQSSSTIPS